MRALQPNEYVLVRKPDGKHYEEFCADGDPAVWDIIHRGSAGKTDGHVPKPGYLYKVINYHNRKGTRVCWKLVHKKGNPQY